jgi:hypothetical protein
MSHHGSICDGRMILTRYLSSSGWVEECSHQTLFDAYINARRRCVLRG